MQFVARVVAAQAGSLAGAALSHMPPPLHPPTLMTAFLAASAADHSSTQVDRTPSRPARPACRQQEECWIHERLVRGTRRRLAPSAAAQLLHCSAACSFLATVVHTCLPVSAHTYSPPPPPLPAGSTLPARPGLRNDTRCALRLAQGDGHACSSTADSAARRGATLSSGILSPLLQSPPLLYPSLTVALVNACGGHWAGEGATSCERAAGTAAHERHAATAQHCRSSRPLAPSLNVRLPHPCQKPQWPPPPAQREEGRVRVGAGWGPCRHRQMGGEMRCRLAGMRLPPTALGIRHPHPQPTHHQVVVHECLMHAAALGHRHITVVGGHAALQPRLGLQAQGGRRTSG